MSPALGIDLCALPKITVRFCTCINCLLACTLYKVRGGTFDLAVEVTQVHIYICMLMRRCIKVADHRIFLIYATYMHIREEVVDEYHYEHTAVRNVPGISVVLDC